MAKLLILNGSPRGRKSNSAIYTEAFLRFFRGEHTECYAASGTSLDEIRSADDILLAFPLYTDGLPSVLMKALKDMEEEGISGKRVHVLINCGFMEAEQNDTAIDMIKLFCRRNGHSFGSSLAIGSGEAFASEPSLLRFMVSGKLKTLAKAIGSRKPVSLKAALPIPKKMFIPASERFWLRKGKGLSKEEMGTMLIEGK